MTTRKLTTKAIAQLASTYVGRTGEIFYDAATGTLRISNGAAAGGVVIDQGTYVAPTAAYISSSATDTISRNGMTIKITSSRIIQMSFDYAGNITGRFAVNGAASSAFSSPNPGGVVTVGVYYDIGTAMTVGDHLVATIVSASLHKIWRVTVTLRDGSPLAGAYAVIEQLK